MEEIENINDNKVQVTKSIINEIVNNIKIINICKYITFILGIIAVILLSKSISLYLALLVIIGLATPSELVLNKLQKKEISKQKDFEEYLNLLNNGIINNNEMNLELVKKEEIRKTNIDKEIENPFIFEDDNLKKTNESVNVLEFLPRKK